MPSASTSTLGRGEAIPSSSWDVIDRLRNTARLLLRAVSVRSGPRSGRYAECETIWHRAEGAAAMALLHADFVTAIARLEEAVRALASTGKAVQGA